MFVSAAIFPPVFPRFFLIALALLLAACGAPQELARPAPAPRDPVAEADALLARGDYAGAAAAYATLAGDGSAAAADRYLAQAVLAFQDAGDHARAEQLLGPLAAASPSPLHALGRARALLRARQPKAAYDLANVIAPDSLSPYQRGVQARISGEAALALGDVPAAARWLVGAFSLPYPTAITAELTNTTWRALSRLSQAQLNAAVNGADAIGAAWYQLALIQSRAAFDPALLAQETAAWQARNPTHPAVAVLPQLAERAAAAAARPRKVALLLPFDATLGVAAAAVRDGFLIAWYRDSQVADRPALAVYSSAAGNIEADYARAVAEGADFVIGPLRKQLVERLKNVPELTTGVLALNVMDARPGASAPPPGFYQFGLTPEGEAEQVAQHARARGSRALVMTPNSAWGRRLLAAFGGAWRTHGGTVLAEVGYSEAADAYAVAVRRALNIDLSEARAAALQRRLGVPVHAEARRRGDVDVILLAAFPDDARQILPQLRYFGAGELPVFATSHVYAGSLNAERDLDLDGLVFGDMPWLFGAADLDSYNLVRRTWPTQAGSFARLYAFGIDAYRILPYLARLRQQSNLRVPGVTGDLWMDPSGVLHRNMTWMKFVNGIPTPVDETRAELTR